MTRDTLQILLDAVHGGMAALDLSEVDHVDDAAVRVLAGLRRQGCTLLDCPRWLALWLERA